MPTEEGLWYARTPGIFGVYEQGETIEEVIRLALESVDVILTMRSNDGELLTDDNEYLRVLYSTGEAKLIDLPPRKDTAKMKRENFYYPIKHKNGKPSSAPKKLVTQR